MYGITRTLDVPISKDLTLDNAMMELEKELQKQGIFVGREVRHEICPDTLGQFYSSKDFVDFIEIFGRVDDITTLGEFTPDVVILGCYNWGRITSKEICDDSHLYKYSTENRIIYLESGDYYSGNSLMTTKIGRKSPELTHDPSRYIHEIVES